MNNTILNYIRRGLSLSPDSIGYESDQERINVVYLGVADELEIILTNMNLIQDDVDENQIFDLATIELGLDSIYQIVNSFINGLTQQSHE